MGYCGDCEHLTIRHNCKKYKKGLAYSSYISRSISTGAMHERCSECEKDYRIAELEEKIKHQWIPVAERMPEGREDVLVCTGDRWILVAWYGTNGQSWHITPTGITHDDIIAWMPLPAPYKEVERDEG